MPVIDTSWLVALFNKVDAHHEKAVRQATGATGLLVPGPILTEFLNLVAHRVSKLRGEAASQRETRSVLRSILDNRAFGVETAYEADRAHELYFRHAKLDYGDAVAASMAERMGQPLLSFDEDQLRSIGQQK